LQVYYITCEFVGPDYKGLRAGQNHHTTIPHGVSTYIELGLPTEPRAISDSRLSIPGKANFHIARTMQR